MSLRDCIITAREGGEMTPEDAGRLLRRLDELTASGLSPEDAKQRLIAETEANAVNGFIRAFEQLLDEGRSPTDAKASVMARMTSREIKDRVAAKLDKAVVLEEPPRWRLSDDQARQFAEAFSTLPTKEQRLGRLKEILGDQSIGIGTLQKVQRDLAERGLIELRGGGKAVEPAAPKPEFDIPRLAKKQTRAAGKPISGVFGANTDLAWTGLPKGEFRANLRHIAEKRARKADPAYLAERGLPPPVGPDLTTPDRVEAHIGEVLASPTFAQVRWRDGAPYSMSIVRLGAQGVDQVVGVSLHKSDGTGRMHIATAYNASREDTVRRLAAALNKNGPEAVKMRKAPDQLNEVLQLVVQVPTADRGPSWRELNASLSRAQAEPRRRSIDPSDRRMRVEANKAARAGQTVYPAPSVRTAVLRVVDDVADIFPDGLRVGVLEKLEPLETGVHDPRVRATYRTADGERFELGGNLAEFTGAGAFFDPAEAALVLNTFGRSRLAGQDAVGDLVEGLARNQLGEGAPGAGLPFELAMRALIFHEVGHVLWDYLDDWVRVLLLDHANRLGMLDRTYRELWAKTHWEPHAYGNDARGQVTIRESYTSIGATAEVLDQEAVMHMVQFAVAGALKADDLAPVRQILEALFNGDKQHMTRALDGEPPAQGRFHALEGPREPSHQDEARLAQRQDATTSLLRELMAEPRTALWNTGRLAGIRNADQIIRTIVESMVRQGHRRDEIAARLRETMGVELPPKDLRQLVSEAMKTERDAPGLGARTPNDGNPATEMLSAAFQARQITELLEVCRS